MVGYTRIVNFHDRIEGDAENRTRLMAGRDLLLASGYVLQTSRGTYGANSIQVVHQTVPHVLANVVTSRMVCDHLGTFLVLQLWPHDALIQNVAIKRLALIEIAPACGGDKPLMPEIRPRG